MTSTATSTATVTCTVSITQPTLTPSYPLEWYRGTGVRCTGTNDPDIFLTPCGVAVNSTGDLYVADLGNNRIVRYSSSGTQTAAWGSGGAACSDSGTGNGQFDSPFGIAIDSADYIYILDSYNHRVQKLDSSFNYISQWGSEGTGNSQFKYPKGIAVDNAGTVYVADTDNNRIQKFSSSGVYVRQWGSNGTSNGMFKSPASVAVDKSGNYVYVADTGNNRIQKFDSNGNYISQWGGFVSLAPQDASYWPPSCSPWGIAVDKTGAVFVCDTANNKIKKYDANGVLLNEWVVASSYFGSPWAITVDATGAVYTVCFTGRIIKYSYN
jgi:DNA-binding beta-propeller fold protein YncE